MNLATLLQGGGNHAIECLEWLAVGDSHLCAQLHKAWLRTCPDDILDSEIVAKEHLLARLGIDNRHQGRQVESKVVDEGRVLTEGVGVVRIVVGREGVARNQNQTIANATAQLGATIFVGICTKHSI